MKIVLIAQIAPAVHGLYAMLRSLGHAPVALLCTREGSDRYGDFAELLQEAPSDLDVVIPASRDRIAPLLRLYEPDLVLCAGFPWKIPPDALAVPRFGVVNGHPSLLPSYRGPSPVSWAIRNGESRIGFTFHRMDPELDTGAILAQTRIALGDEHSWEELAPKIFAAVGELLPRMLERVESGDPGDPQEGEGSYETFFEPNYARIDWTQARSDVYRQVRSWRFASASTDPRGALADFDGETVRVLRISLDETDGRTMECGDGTIWIVETEAA